MYKNNFNESELPYPQFEALGFKREDVLALPPVDLQALLSGRRTAFIQFKDVKLDEQVTIAALDAKISLTRNEDGSVSLKTHPILKETPNIFRLSADELTAVYSNPGQLIEKAVTKANGEKEAMLIQFDPDTKEFVGKNLKDIIPPDSINDVKLTDSQKEDWQKGKELDIDGDQVRIDLSSPMGFIGKIVTVGLDGGISLTVTSLVGQLRSIHAENPDRPEEQKQPGIDEQIDMDVNQPSRGRSR